MSGLPGQEDLPGAGAGQPAPAGLHGRVEWLWRAMRALSAVALFSMMLLAVADVLGRKFASRSVPGAVELTEIMMLLMVFMALPLVSQQRSHVQLDLAEGLVPRALRALRERAGDVVCAVYMLGSGYLAWTRAGRALVEQESSTILQVPLYPFYYLVAVLFAVTAVAHLVHAIGGASQSRESDPGEGSLA